MDVNLSPRLEELGRVPAANVDFMRLAALAFLVDRSVERGKGPGVRWERELELTVPVSDPDRWSAVSGELGSVMHLLSGDFWSLTFTRERAPHRQLAPAPAPASVVCLFSGGADSLSGAILAYQRSGRAPVLASHWDFTAVAGVQNRLVRSLKNLWGERPQHVQLQMRRASRQVGSGLTFPDERSRRSRSLLFIALGLAVASVRDAELWICENGFTSLNPPLSGERRGSLTTRTTHPAFLDRLTNVLRGAGLDARLHNPFESMTKGQVLRALAEVVGDDSLAAELLAMSHSCGKPSYVAGFDPGAQCGVCFGCLVRRAAFAAAGLEDRTLYIESTLRGEPRRDEWLNAKRRQTIRAIEYRIRRGFTPQDILALGLPARISTSDALRLVHAGLGELNRLSVP
jgi:7-cyano-7-deazaguanine synthase in queuosine biosynthesis